jgi:hypothetical protein
MHGGSSGSAAITTAAATADEDGWITVVRQRAGADAAEACGSSAASAQAV